jgi:hypothetical protein
MMREPFKQFGPKDGLRNGTRVRVCRVKFVTTFDHTVTDPATPHFHIPSPTH